MQEEIFPIVNSKGEVIGSATRTECHAGTFILHPVVHLHIFNTQGDIKCNQLKKHQPNGWCFFDYLRKREERDLK